MDPVQTKGNFARGNNGSARVEESFSFRSPGLSGRVEEPLKANMFEVSSLTQTLSKREQHPMTLSPTAGQNG